MNILHVTPCYAPAWAYGPVPASVANLAQAQVDAGHRVAVLTTDAMAPHERLAPGETLHHGIRVVRVPNVSGSTRAWFGCSTPIGMRSRARRLFGSETFDLVHLHELITVENLRVVPVVPVAVPIVLSMHAQATSRSGVSPWLAGLWDAAGGRLVRARIRVFVATSQADADGLTQSGASLTGGSPDVVVRVIPDGEDLTPFTAAADRAAARAALDLGEGPVLLVPGRLCGEPSARTLLDALVQLRQEHSTMRVVFAGADTGGRAALEESARRADLAAHVSFAGYVAPSAMPRLVAAAEVAVLPVPDPDSSTWIRGAMAGGIPVIGTALTGAGEASDAILRLTTAEPSAAEWAAAIRTVLGDSEMRARMADAGRRDAAKSAWPAVAAQWDALYATVRLHPA